MLGLTQTAIENGLADAEDLNGFRPVPIDRREDPLHMVSLGPLEMSDGLSM